MWQKYAGEVYHLANRLLPDMVGLLQKLIEIESPSTDPASIFPVFELLEKELAATGYRSLHVPGKKTAGYLFASPETRLRHQPVQLLVGHADTVWPVGTLTEMPCKVADGRLSGPGSFDMKSGLMLLVFSLRIIRELNISVPITPVVLINSDEETGSHESARAIVRVAKKAERVFVLEPALGTTGRLKTSRRGGGRFTIRIVGKAAHAGLDPGKGASAIMELASVIQKLFGINDESRGITINVGMIEGGIQPNVVAPNSSAVVDVRVTTMADAIEVDRQIRSIQPENPETTIFIEGDLGRPPMEKNDRNTCLWNAAVDIAEHLGIVLEDGRSGGGSDGNWTSQYAATLDGLGGVGDGAHARHEFVYVDKLPERAALLTSLLLYPSVAEVGHPNQVFRSVFSRH